jgi:hypothetical protein
VTSKTQFAMDEWQRLTQLPRWVVAAASASQQDLAYRTNIEVEAGLIASANGRQVGNDFVTEVATDTMKIFDDRSTVRAIDFSDRDAAITVVLDRVRDVNQLLKTKADLGDAMAYRQWLVAITDVVISAARTGDVLGFGGQRVTALEHNFRDRIVQVLQS